MGERLSHSQPARPSGLSSRAASRWSSVRRTLQAAGPWWVAATFATYSAQWLAVIGFLPTIYAAVGVSGAAMGPLTALVAAANIVGNVAAGRALQRGVRGPTLLTLGFAAMALASVLAFAPMAHGASPWLGFVALLAFSGMGGLIPGTLFAMSLRVAPGPDTVATTVGWLQQWSSMGQFVGPPIAAWLAGGARGRMACQLAAESGLLRAGAAVERRVGAPSRAGCCARTLSGQGQRLTLKPGQGLAHRGLKGHYIAAHIKAIHHSVVHFH